MKTHFSLDICQICLNRILISFISCLKVRPPPLHLTRSSNTFILPRKPPTFYIVVSLAMFHKNMFWSVSAFHAFIGWSVPDCFSFDHPLKIFSPTTSQGCQYPGETERSGNKSDIHCSMLLLCSICLSDNNCY